MLKPLTLTVLLALSAGAKPAIFRGGDSQVTFPGNFTLCGKVASYLRPQANFFAIRWESSQRQGCELLVSLQRNMTRRGAQVSFVKNGGVEGLEIREELAPQNRNWSRFYLVGGRCYEFRVNATDQQAHPEIAAFFDSIQFRQKSALKLQQAMDTVSAGKPVLKYVYADPACIDNLKEIYNACLTYAADHRGSYPSSLSELSLSRSQLCCPKSGRSSYVFSNSAAGLVVYCKGQSHLSEGYPKDSPRISGRALLPINPRLAPRPAPAAPYTF